VTDGDAGVRAEAATTLGMFRAQEGTSALVTALQSDSSATVRKRAAWALGETHANAAVAGQALQTAAASDPSPFVRSLAAAALTKLTR
jgi:HEAT repeat protein